MKIETQTKLLRLKGILNEVSHASFSYSNIQRDFPMGRLSDEDANKVIIAFEQILEDVKSSIMKNEYGNKNTTT